MSLKNPLISLYSDQYDVMVDWVIGCINPLSDEEYKQELSPGKSTGIWILGHLVVCDDDFSEYMGKGKILYPELIELFGQGSKPVSPENYPSVSALKEYWNNVCVKNRKVYSELNDSELDEPHALMANNNDDYFKTKKGVIVHWQLHQMYHAGQLGVLISRAGKSKF